MQYGTKIAKKLNIRQFGSNRGGNGKAQNTCCFVKKEIQTPVVAKKKNKNPLKVLKERQMPVKKKEKAQIDPSKALIGVVQMCSHNDPEKNFLKIKNYVEELAAQGAQLICLPDNCAYQSTSGGYTGNIFKENLETGPYITKYKSLAKDNNVFLSLGSFQEANAKAVKVFSVEYEVFDGKFDTHIVIDKNGDIVGECRKSAILCDLN